MTQGYAISVKKVEKSFGTTRVLKDINIEINEGEFVAIVGKSGCGKSTLLRLICGLDSVTGGNIEITDEQKEAEKSGIKFLFQEARLLPWQKVWKNIALVSGKKTKEEAIESLKAVKLEDKADEWPGTLSGGQKQRVSLARALSSEPKVLLLDEPLGALDALTRIEMQVLIENLWKEKGFTSILVTHDVSEAVYLADRVILIENGEVTMDERISLARPRKHDSSFAYFENKILSRLLEQNETLESVDNFII